ncbi:TPA: hypothetical protein ACH3X3_001395 [Trebouxia sp. C0006]
MAFSLLRCSLKTSAGIQRAATWQHISAPAIVPVGRKSFRTTTSAKREHAETDNLDQKDLTKQKGDVKPGYSASSTDEDVSLFFRPQKVGAYEVPNRLVYAPLTRCRAIDSNPQKNMVEYYRQRGAGSEGGLVIAEGTVISDTGFGYSHVPGIFTKKHIERWQDITKACKDAGGLFFCQLWHVGRSSHADFQPNKAAPLSSAAVAAEGDIFTPEGSKPHSTPKALDKAGIAKIVDEFRQAARNAIDAGFNGVEIHGANGYIIDQFIKPTPNNRTDEYGGSVEKRCRLCLEVVKAVTDEVGADKVGIRLSPYGEFGSVADDKPNATNRYLTEQLNKFGLAYLHMVEPRIAGNTEVDVTDKTYNLSHFRKLFDGTFIAAGGYNRERAIEALQKDHADLICFGRHYLANPDLPKRFREHAELNSYNRDTFYTNDDAGYIDYPFLEDGIKK